MHHTKAAVVINPKVGYQPSLYLVADYRQALVGRRIENRHEKGHNAALWLEKLVFERTISLYSLAFLEERMHLSRPS